MNIEFISSEIYQQLLDKIEAIEISLKKQSSYTIKDSEKWLDNKEVCKILKITPRTAQNYRDKGILAYSQIGSKIYYRFTDIEKLLQKHYKKNGGAL